MKTIYFVRHAKSSWDDPMLRDHDRPLNARGVRDAPKMAARLADLGVAPDGILSSTARRARLTAEYFRSQFSIPMLNILHREELYHAWPDAIEQQVQKLPDEWDTVLLFGHNPGYTDLANRLVHDNYIGNVPTCGIIVAEAPIEQWNKFRLEQAKRVGYLYPKQAV